MIFKQYRFEPLGQASYILDCMRSKQGIVVDPISDLGIDHYMLEAADLGLSLAGVAETHVHADYVSCARDLAREANVPHYMHESLEPVARFQFTPVKDGEVIELGRVAIEAMHTPGHTPEHLCHVGYDRTRSEDAWLVLTGDCLLVGDVGRLDLLLEDQALNVMDEEERIASQYRSIKQRLFTLPDHVEVWPGHYGGSTCGGANMSGKASSTIFYERSFNLAINQPDVAAFAKFVKGDHAAVPRQLRENQGSQPRLDRTRGRGGFRGSGSGRASILVRVERRRGGGRPAPPAHVRPRARHGRDQSAVQPRRPRRSRRDGASREREVRRLLGLGPGRLGGRGDPARRRLRGAGTSRGRHRDMEGGRKATSSMPVVTAEQLYSARGELGVVDAREAHEYRYGHIAGARLLPSMEAWDKVDEMPTEKPLAVVCGDQVRSALVASILRRAGRDARLVSGGMSDWLERGYPVEKTQKSN